MTRPGSVHVSGCTCDSCNNAGGVIQVVVPGTGGGVQGAQGLQGRQGIQGATGVQGAQGLQGATGAGTQGATGSQGPSGTQGPTGSGTQGTQGLQGTNGTQGAQGLQGSTGAGTQGVQGAQGADGTQGIAGSGVNSTDDVPEGVDNLYYTPERVSYQYTQATSSSTWVITHNLGFYPNIVVQDSAHSVVEGEISYDSVNQVTLTFQAAFSGKAYLS